MLGSLSSLLFVFWQPAFRPRPPHMACLKSRNFDGEVTSFERIWTGHFSLMKQFVHSGFNSAEIAVDQIFKPVTYFLAAAYFLVDAVFIAVAKPVSDWLAKHLVLRKLRIWIRSLRPYPSLALFSVPVIILEPVKPVAAYLAATGQIMSSILTLIVGELLKLVLIERLFSLTRDKLMKIPAFAWAYTKFQQAKAWLEATEAWQAIQTLSRAARNYVAQMKRSGAVRFRQS